MGFFDLFKTGGAGKNRSAGLERTIERQIKTLLGGSLVSLDDNAETYIDDGYNKNLFVYMCVSYIISRASDIPIRLYRHTPRQDSDQEIVDHPILQLLKKPNPYTDGKELIEKSLGYNLLTGNTYIWKIESATPRLAPLELHVLPSQFIDIQAGRSWAHAPKKYWLRLFGDTKWDADEIVHFKRSNFSFENGQYLYGQSPLRAALTSINQSNSTSEAFTKQAQNDGVKGLLMQEPSNEVNPMTPDELKDFKKKVKDSLNGNSKRGLIEATNSLFKYVQLGMNAADMQLLESHKIGRNDICAVYQLSSMLFNDNSASTFNNLAEAKKSAYTDSIIPLLNNFISKLNAEIVSKRDPNLYLKADISGIEELKADRAKLTQALSQAWWIPTSSKQRMSEVEPDGVLPEYLIPQGLFPIGGDDLPPIDEDIDKAVREFGKDKL